MKLLKKLFPFLIITLAIGLFIFIMSNISYGGIIPITGGRRQIFFYDTLLQPVPNGSTADTLISDTLALTLEKLEGAATLTYTIMNGRAVALDTLKYKIVIWYSNDMIHWVAPATIDSQNVILAAGDSASYGIDMTHRYFKHYLYHLLGVVCLGNYGDTTVVKSMYHVAGKDAPGY